MAAKAKPRVIVRARPCFNKSGRVTGWKIQSGNEALLLASMREATESLRETIKGFLAKGRNVTARVYDSSDELTTTVSYSIKGGCVEAKTVTAKPKAKAKPKGKAKGKAKATKPRAAKPKTLSTGLKRYHAYMKAAKARGLTPKQAKAAWKRDKSKVTSMALARELGGKTGRRAPSSKPARKTSATATALPKPSKMKPSSKKKTAPSKKTGRKPSAYNNFIKAFFAAHPVSNYRGATNRKKAGARMKAAGRAWKALTDAQKAKAKTLAGARGLVK